MQEKYWRYMVQIKAWIFYLDLYGESSYKWEKRINVFSAIVSSTSIAVLSAIKGFLPYSRRLKSIVPFMEDLKFLYNRMEYTWFKVASGEMTEEEINEILYEFKNEYTNIENKHLKDETLLENEKFKKKSDMKTDAYFENNF